jgi:hypothetical protein
MRRRAELVGLFALVVASASAGGCVTGCEKQEPPREVKIEPRYATSPVPPAIGASRGASDAAAENPGSNAIAAGASSGPSAFDLALLAADASFLRRTVVTQFRIDAAAPDPDRQILDDAHMRAARCYDGAIFGPSGPRTATVDVTVIPTGKVTRAEVRSPDTREPEVLACLKSLGERLVFTERIGDGGGALRTYAIDVSVVPAH